MSNEDVRTKNYVDKNAIIIAGGVVSGDIVTNRGRPVRLSQFARLSFTEPIRCRYQSGRR